MESKKGESKRRDGTDEGKIGRNKGEKEGRKEDITEEEKKEGLIGRQMKGREGKRGQGT